MPALEWSPLEDEGRSAPAVLYTKKVSNRLLATHEEEDNLHISEI